MAQVIRQHQPVDIASCPGRLPLRQQMRRCSCGQLTFLDLPCRGCGRTRLQPEFDRAHLCGKKWFVIYTVAVLVSTLIAMWLLALIWPWLAVLPVLVTAFFVLAEWNEGGESFFDTFFLFHRERLFDRMGQLKTADAECLFEIQQAYDQDLLRLEEMLEPLKQQQDCSRQAEQIFLQARQLAQVYHNRRLSALMAHCLLLMHPEESIRVDMDQVCRFLYPQDLADMATEGKLIVWLDSWVKASCLPVGEDTARALVRICGLRVESITAETYPGDSCRKIVQADRCQRSFTRLEVSMLQAIWAASGLGQYSQTGKKAVLDKWAQAEKNGALDRPLQQSARDHLAARYWADICWYERDKIPFFGFNMMLARSANKQEKELLQLWASKEQEQEEAEQ